MFSCNIFLLLALPIVVPVSFQFDDNILFLLCLDCAWLESFCMIETSFTLLYSWHLLPSARFLQLYLLMTLKHHSKQLRTMFYTDIYNVVLRGVLALVVFADDSSDVNWTAVMPAPAPAAPNTKSSCSRSLSSLYSLSWSSKSFPPHQHQTHSSYRCSLILCVDICDKVEA